MELFDLYDIDRQKLNKTIIRDKKLPKNTRRLVIHICIFNHKGEMLIQQRSAKKHKRPNIWDISLGGCVQAGENSRQAARRELQEELGLDYDFSNVNPHLTINFDEGFDDFYLITKDENLKNIKFKDGEVQKVKWATEEEIFSLIDSEEFIPYHKFLIHTFFAFHTLPISAF